MKFFEVESYQELSERAANIIIQGIANKPNFVLGLATGSTPIGAYQWLIDGNRCGKVDFSEVTTFNLDEYVGLPVENEHSYRYFMNDRLFNHINIKPKNTHVPCGLAENLAEEGARYDALIKECGGIDLQLLGIGVDGHIGFNEPDNVFIKSTHEVVLDESTIRANARFFSSMDEVPKTAITMGMMSIMKAKKILLLANGEAKKAILDRAFSGEIDPRVPASILQLHPDVTVIYTP